MNWSLLNLSGRSYLRLLCCGVWRGGWGPRSLYSAKL